MAENSSLLAAILANSGDNGPRLVYADWLSERGDPRGEFIQIQCQLGGSRYGAAGHLLTWGKEKRPTTAEELEAREKKLLTKHQKDWLAPMRAHIRTWSWSRGFVSRIVADGSKFLAQAEAIVDHTPLDELELTALKPPQHDELSRSRCLAHIRFLRLAQQKIGPKSAHLFFSPYLSHVEELEIWGNPLGEAGGVTLSRAAHLGNLRKLHLYHCGLGNNAVQALAQARFFSQLTDLDLSSNPFSSSHVAAIAQNGSSLRKLNLNKSRLSQPEAIGDAGAIAIANSPAMQNLEELLFDGTITEIGAKALLESPYLCSIKRLAGVVGELTGVPATSAIGEAFLKRFSQ